jgi:hypothetical protein
MIGDFVEKLDLLFIPEIKFTEGGSRILWRQLKDRCEKISLISTSDQFRDYLDLSFKEITGYNISKDGYVYVEKLDNKKGISAGMVYIQWWNKIGFPVLVKRYIEGKSPYAGEGDFIDKMLSEKKKSWEIHEGLNNE